MAAGIPGAGIGGVFYLVSALAMPFRELALMVVRRDGAGTATRWIAIAQQVSLALGIVAALWGTGLALGWAFSSPAVHQAETLHAAPGAPSALRFSALVLSMTTLLVVLALVQAARLVLSQRGSDAARRRLPAAMLLAVLTTTAGATAAAQSRATASTSRPTADPVRARRAAADSAYASGDAVRAEREYRAVLSLAPDDSRALFRLAQLSRSNVAEAERLFHRYTVVQPRDAWGHLALADVRVRRGNLEGALDAVDAAARIAPSERDVLLARGRILARAGRTDDAIGLYERRIEAAPADAEAWRELAALRRRAGRGEESRQALARAQAVSPDAGTARRAATWRALDALAIEPSVGGSRDSDANATWRAALGVALPASDRSRATLTVARQRSLGGGDTTVVDGAQLALAWRPRAAIVVDLAAGMAQVRARELATGTPLPSGSPGPASPRGPNSGGRIPRGVSAVPTAVSFSTPTVSARARWRAPGDGHALDVRASRALLDATPLLARNRVTRNEAAVQGETPLVLGLRARGQGRVGRYDAAGESNTRTVIAGAMIRPVAGWGEVAAVMQRIGYRNATTRGYFAPRAANVAEAAVYLERESARGVVLSVDAGVGAQRVAEFGAAMGGWTSAVRGWTRLDVPIGVAHSLRAELDAYDGGVAREAASAGRWRWTSLSLGLHLVP